MAYDLWDDLGLPMALLRKPEDLEGPEVREGVVVYVVSLHCRMIRRDGRWVRLDQEDS